MNYVLLNSNPPHGGLGGEGGKGGYAGNADGGPGGNGTAGDGGSAIGGNAGTGGTLDWPVEVLAVMEVLAVKVEIWDSMAVRVELEDQPTVALVGTEADWYCRSC